MKKNLLNSVLFVSAIALSTMTSCEKDDQPTTTPDIVQGADNDPRKYITLTAAFPDDATPPVAGNGGTLAYSLTEAEAKDASKVIDIYKDGYSLRSQRTRSEERRVGKE